MLTQVTMETQDGTHVAGVGSEHEGAAGGCGVSDDIMAQDGTHVAVGSEDGDDQELGIARGAAAAGGCCMEQ